MTSKEIVKALRRGLFSNTLLQMAAHKIEEFESKVNRLQAENERLKKVTGDVIKAIFQEEIQEAKAEAYKEFAYELQQIPREWVYKHEIGNLLKEKAGD